MSHRWNGGSPNIRRRVLASTLFVAFAGCAANVTASSPPQPGPAAADVVHWAALDSLLQASFPADGPGASAIVVRNGAVLYRGAVGMADLELGVPMHPEMVFNLFSVSKQFTGAAILMLAEEGKLSLSDPITRFLPDYPVGGRAVTVEHLLAHTSGMANYSDLPEWWPMLRNHVSPDELIALFRTQPFRFEPGERWEYNNSGYVLLGKIIEQCSGMTYGDFVRTRILEPLGMTSSYVYDAPGIIIPRRVAGYSQDERGWRNAEYFSLTHGYAVGNMLSTVDDLARWDASIDRGELLSASSWRRALASFRLNDGSEARYAAGRSIGRLGTLETVEHGGNLVGGMNHVLRVPAERLFVAVLVNSQPAATHPEQLALAMATRVLGIDAELPEVPLDASRLDEYVGVYRITDGVTRTITREGDRLYSQRSDGGRFEVYPIGEDLFAFRQAGLWMQFVRDNGRVAAVVMRPRTDAPGPPAPRVD